MTTHKHMHIPALGSLVSFVGVNDFEILGRVVAIRHEVMTGNLGYVDVDVNYDGTIYTLGTGGSLGETWANCYCQQVFLHVH